MLRKNSPRPLVALFAILGLVLASCSATGGRPRDNGADGGGAGGVDTPRYTVAMVSHGAPGDTFWDLVRAGAEDAARKNNIELRYSSSPQAPEQANFIQNAIDSKVDGLAITMPTPEALGPAARRAVDAGIPTVALNAGMGQYQDFGISAFYGQDEAIAGKAAGERILEAQGKRVLCIIHEQGNASQETRCSGVRDGASGAHVELLYVNGMDLTAVQSTVQAKLAEDRNVDWIMGLNAAVTLAAVKGAQAASSQAKIGSFDTNSEMVDAIADGRVQWAVDQQPYLQGYLAIDSMWLAKRNGSVIGGGQPVMTGPSFVDQSNVDQVAEYAKERLR